MSAILAKVNTLAGIIPVPFSGHYKYLNLLNNNLSVRVNNNGYGTDINRYGQLSVNFVDNHRSWDIDMKKNVGLVDRLIRAVVGCFLLYYGLIDTSLVNNQLASYIMLAFAGINLFTAIIGSCPMYSLANLSTAPKSSS